MVKLNWKNSGHEKRVIIPFNFAIKTKYPATKRIHRSHHKTTWNQLLSGFSNLFRLLVSGNTERETAVSSGKFWKADVLDNHGSCKTNSMCNTYTVITSGDFIPRELFLTVEVAELQIVFTQVFVAVFKEARYLPFLPLQSW